MMGEGQQRKEPNNLPQTKQTGCFSTDSASSEPPGAFNTVLLAGGTERQMMTHLYNELALSSKLKVLTSYITSDALS